MHRAVEILNPTTELTGIYKCRVSSFHDEDFASKKMIIYSPARSMNMTFVKTKKRSVTFFCSAVGAHPEPTLKLILLNEENTRNVDPHHLEAKMDPDGGFNISLEAKVKDKILPKETLMQCILEIPGTNYRIRREVVYFPDYAYRGFDGGSSTFYSSYKLIFATFVILFPSQQLLMFNF